MFGVLFLEYMQIKIIKIEEKEKLESSRIFLESLSVDSILDKISKVGIENITESEKRFLDKILIFCLMIFE